MILPDGWFDWAERDPGPPDKRYTELCISEGVVFHSAVGYYRGWLSRLFSAERLPNGRYSNYAAASVTGFILFNGALKQHYPVNISCWASGSRYPNTHFNSFEQEGGYPDNRQPWTVQQTETAIRVTKEIAVARQWTPRRPNSPQDVLATLYEHNECVRWGSAFTACPSGRDNWDAILRSFAMPTPEDQLKIIRVLQPDLTATDLDILVAKLKYLFALAGKPWPQ